MSLPSSRPAEVDHLSRLPNELIEKIAQQCDDETLIVFVVELTRKIYEASFTTYGQRFFKTLKFCFYPHSLQALQDICNTERLAKFVEHVAFGTEDVGLLDPRHEYQF
jgi:lipid A disaccharide synthetase